MLLYYLLGIAAVVCIVALVSSVVMIRKQKEHEYDNGMNAVSRKHNILANPALIAYVLFPIIVVLGAVLFMYYYGG